MSFDPVWFKLMQTRSGGSSGGSCDCTVASSDTIINTLMEMGMVAPIAVDDNTILMLDDNTMFIK